MLYDLYSFFLFVDVFFFFSYSGSLLKATILSGEGKTEITCRHSSLIRNRSHNFEELWIPNKLVRTDFETDLSIKSYNNKILSGKEFGIAPCIKTDLFCIKSHNL